MQLSTRLLYSASVFLAVIQGVHSEVFTSLAQLERVLESEYEVALHLRQYASSERQRLEELDRIAGELEQHSAEGTKDPEAFLGNPVNAFKLLKRFTVDWDDINSKFLKNNDNTQLDRVFNAADGFPEQEDLLGAANALLRLQDTYALSAHDMARGQVPGASLTANMTAGDCFELGRQAYNYEDYYHTLHWMQVALDLLNGEEKKNPTTDKAEVLDYMSFATFQQGNIVHATNLTLQWLELEPGNSRAQKNLKWYRDTMWEKEEERRKERVATPYVEEFKNERKRDPWKLTSQFDDYERLCRGEETKPNDQAHLLTCQYVRPHPMFILVPAKEEVMFLDPFIAIYHNLMTDKEADMIKRISKPKLHRSGVFTYSGGNQKPVQDYRTSKSAWIEDEEHPMIRRVSERTSALTDLSLDTVELFQVVNYGIGGHYEPHFDFARPNEIATFDPEVGNRIITVIFYVAAPEAGGATVFPDLGVKLWPEKGSCAVWWNLMRNGEGDYRTKHAGCPTITGSKWIANKWYHERGQEFRRSCLLDPSK